MNFCWCTITVNGDIEESIRFYTKIIKLEIKSRFSPRPDMDIVFLKDNNGVEIELIKYADKPVLSEKEGISLGFTVDSLEDTLRLINDNEIPLLEGPFNTPKVKYFFIKDPNGVTIQFVENL